jgi:DNA repair protein RecO (recombination protein O)
VPEAQTSLAIVLRWRAYGESDKIATLLTRDFGKLTGIGKGARRSKRRFANSLEPLARVRVHFRQRPQASLAFLESCDLLVPLGNLLEPSRFAYGSYLAELADQLTVEGHAVTDLYELLDEALSVLQEGPASAALLRAFEVQLLTRAGFAPEFETCHHCHGDLSGAAPALLDPMHGTFSCRDCRSRNAASIEITAGVVSRLRMLRESSLRECRRLPLGPQAAETAQLTGRLLAQHLSRPLQSLRLIAQLSSSPV